MYESSQRSRNTAGAAWQPIVTLASPTTCPTCSHPTWRPRTSRRAVQRREHVLHWKSFLLSNRIERKLRGVQMTNLQTLFHVLWVACFTNCLVTNKSIKAANKTQSCQQSVCDTFVKLFFLSKDSENNRSWKSCTCMDFLILTYFLSLEFNRTKVDSPES